MLRREGLYSSHLTTWRAARERGELAGAAKKRGPVRRVVDPRDKKLAEQAREISRWHKRAARAEALVELQKQGDKSPYPFHILAEVDRLGSLIS